MALYKSPKQMIADKHLSDITRNILETMFMPKVNSKSQLIADLNFIRTIAKKKAQYHYDVNTMVSDRATDLSVELVVTALSDSQQKYEDALKNVREITNEIKTATNELNAVVKEMFDYYMLVKVSQKAAEKNKAARLTKRKKMPNHLVLIRIV